MRTCLAQRWLRTAVCLAALTTCCATFANARPLDPERMPAMRDSARALLDAGHADAAARVFRTIVSADSLDGIAWLGLATSELRAAHPVAAIDADRRALAIGFGQRPVRAYQVATLFAGLGQRDSALAWLATSLAAGYGQRSEIAADSAFVAYRGDPVFRRLAAIADPPASAAEGWRSDLRLLQDEARRLAAGPNPFARTTQFDSLVDDLYARIPQLSGEQIYVGMQRIVTSLGNGHSVLYPLSTTRLTLHMLPVDFYRFSDGLYVTGGAGPGAVLAGRRVLAINGVDSDDALRRATPYIDRDNPMGILWIGPYFLGYPVLLEASGIPGPADSVRLTVEKAGSAPAAISLAAGDFRPPDKLRAPASLAAPPLWLSRPDANYWLKPLPKSAAVYVQYNQVRDDDALPIAAFADSLLRTARRTAARRIIVDVRRNNGGSGPLNLPLVRALVRFEGWGPGQRIYVLMGRNTFSAAQNFINQVEQLTDAIFVGEPSGSRPNFVGEDTDIVLPYSGIRGSMGSRYFQDSDPTDDRLWISPGIPVAYSSGDYFAGRDPALAAVLAHIALEPPRAHK